MSQHNIDEYIKNSIDSISDTPVRGVEWDKSGSYEKLFPLPVAKSNSRKKVLLYSLALFLLVGTTTYFLTRDSEITVNTEIVRPSVVIENRFITEEPICVPEAFEYVTSKEVELIEMVKVKTVELEAREVLNEPEVIIDRRKEDLPQILLRYEEVALEESVKVKKKSKNTRKMKVRIGPTGNTEEVLVDDEKLIFSKKL